MTLTRDRKSTLLSAARLFDGVDADGMDRIAERAIEVEFPADHVIARQGEIGTGFFVVVTGSVPASSATGGPSRPLGRATSSGSCPCSTGARASPRSSPTVPTTCLALASWDFEAVLLEQPRVALAILRGLAARLRDLTEADRH